MVSYLSVLACLGGMCRDFMLMFDAWSADVPTIDGGAALELPVAMRSSVAVTVITMQR